MPPGKPWEYDQAIDEAGSNPEAAARQQYMAGSKVASGGAAALEGANPALGEAIGIGATAALTGPAAIGMAGRLPGVIGGAGKFLAARPTTAAGVAAAAPSLLRGDVKGAAVEGVMTAAGLKGAGNLLKFLLRFKSARAATTEAAKEVVQEVTKRAAPAVKSAEEGAVAAMKAGLPLSQEEIKILTQLRGHMDTSAGRVAVKDAVKQAFPNNWQEAWKFLTASRTTMPGRLM